MKNLGLLRAAGTACLALLSCVPGTAQVDLQAVGNDHVSITINGQPFSDFYIGPAYAKPFLAPLRTASGLTVSRRFPMERVEGESNDHPHHRGLWIGYGTISDVNFWENDPNSKTSGGNPSVKGLLVLEQLNEVKPGKKSGSITATFGWRAPGHGDSKGDMIEERRTLTFYAEPEVRTVDVDTTLTAKTRLKFEDTKEGFFAIRLADSMTAKNGGMMTNSEGAQTEKDVWGKRADWVDYDGTVEGQKVGIVIFDHPQNLNHPPRWHARAYGLFAVNPFGLRDFDAKATGRGGYEMAPGASLHLRYRVIIHPGDVPKRKIESWYAAYAKKTK
jgi:Methane oxygenase PmoA